MARFLLRPLHFACLGIVAAALLPLAPRNPLVLMARGATPPQTAIAAAWRPGPSYLASPSYSRSCSRRWHGEH